MRNEKRAGADWRALTGAAVLGSAVGLALGGAYMAGGMARAATDHSRASRLAAAAADGYSEQALQDAAASMDPGVLRIARRHDPFTMAGAAERDRQNAILVARLERQGGAQGQGPLLRVSLNATPAPAAPFRLGGALESSRELECLTQAVYYEARGETPSGQAAVAQVVLNRVRHPAFPKTVCGVVFQGAARKTGCQFSFACNGVMRRRVEPAAWRRAERIAVRALGGEVMADVGRATHFHTTAVAPYWGPRMTRVTQVGQHVFYRFNRNPAPMRMLARSEEVSPEQTETPLFAAVEAQEAAEPAASLGGEIRLTSAVVQPGAKVSLDGMGGPLEPAVEPASAPAMAKAQPAAAKSAEGSTKAPAAKASVAPAKPQGPAANKAAARDDQPAEPKARPVEGGKAG